jgi:hypothetical protein
MKHLDIFFQSVFSFKNGFLMLMGVALSCESDLKYDLVMEDFNPKLAVNCTFTNDSLWNVFVSKSSDIYANESWESIENAVVRVTGSNGIVTTLVPVGKGQYTSSAKPVFNEIYTLDISVAGIAPVEASDFLPEQIKIDAITFKDSVSIVDSSYQSQVIISITNNPATTDFYQFIIYQIDSTNKIVPLWLDSDDISFENTTNSGIVTTSPIQEYLLANDVLFNGAKHDFYIEFSKIVEVGDIYVEVRSLSESLHEYALTYSKAAGNVDNPFIEPIRVFSNIQNGIGIFGGYTSVKQKIEIVTK